MRRAPDDSGSIPPFRPLVAIVPGAAMIRYRRLLSALAEAYPVRFADVGSIDLATADAVIVFPGGQRPQPLGVPSLVLAGHEQETDRRATPFHVSLASTAGLARPLRGQRVTERTATHPEPVNPDQGTDVLATVNGAPIWIRYDEAGVVRETASVNTTDLEDGELLRDHLRAGCFWSLLPIVHFLRDVSRAGLEPRGTLRACFVIDDPNVRFSSYGSVRFIDLARDARAHGYHVAIATIPLDLTLPGHRAARVFRDHPRFLSLAVHGNDHVRLELERPRTRRETHAMVRTAIARVERFERRAGVRIDRVMCPPHGGCSLATLQALFAYGFKGLAASRPFPWDGFRDRGEWRLGGWLPAQLAGGLPVLPRYSLANDPDDLVFRALLGQPLIVYCHQSDLRRGLDPFRDAARRVAGLGDVEWSSLATIARRNVVVSVRDDVPTVTLYSRDVHMRRPAGNLLRIEIPRIHALGQPVSVWVDGTEHDAEMLPGGPAVITVANEPSSTSLRIQLLARSHPPATDLTAVCLPVWPLARRMMTESRDRILPAIR